MSMRQNIFQHSFHDFMHPFVFYAINKLGKQRNLQVVVLVLKGLLGYITNN